MYRCIREYMERGWFVILIICRYGNMWLVVGILEKFPGNTWFGVLGLVGLHEDCCMVGLEYVGFGWVCLYC